MTDHPPRPDAALEAFHVWDSAKPLGDEPPRLPFGLCLLGWAIAGAAVNGVILYIGWLIYRAYQTAAIDYATACANGAACF
ncbi:hypothetical protein [Oceaniglobus trochenteri]|uniref:hypothetical protein n=1 Tax=Oceaniglobus trochenteri TaxID=2763260 RepID=UPI001CFFFED5|nr:hypothetical protein [Oceaniglobus trochenteri]